MNILIVTPNEPFYLSGNINYLLRNLSSEDRLVGCVLLKPTPYGNRLNFKDKAIQTLKIFGSKFFLYYGLKFVWAKIFLTDVKDVLNKFKIPIIHLSENINSPNSLSLLKIYKPDLIISILGNQIFKESILNLPTHGCINLHN